MAAELLVGANGATAPPGGEEGPGFESVPSASGGPSRPNRADQASVQSQLLNSSTSRRLVRELQRSGDFWSSSGVGSFLDDSTWPIVHGSRQSYDSTTYKGPLGTAQDDNQYVLYNSQQGLDDDSVGGPVLGNFMANMMSMGDSPGRRALGEDGHWNELMALLNFEVGDANAVSIITQRISDSQQLLWTSTIQNVLVFRQTKGRAHLERLASYDHGRNLRFHGSYAFCASNGTATGFFTTMDDAVTRYVLQGSDAGGWSIARTGVLAMPSRFYGLAGGATHLVGMTALADGTVVACSKEGDVMAVRVDASGGFVLRDVLRLADSGVGQGEAIHVSNSISSEGQQVFIVTERELVRVDFNPTTQKLAYVWGANYGKQEGWWVGRLGPGSGSTPTVTSCGGKSLVVITDGTLPMNLLFFSADSGVLVGSRRVQFGKDEDGWEPTTSEQSVAVDGCRAFVVQNYLGKDRLEDHIFCASAPAGRVVRRRLADFCIGRTRSDAPEDRFGEKSCPAAFGCSGYGAALYELTTQTSGPPPYPVRRVWARNDVSCGTSIPLISTNPASPVVYCSGLKSGSSQWTLLGLDLWTGADRADLTYYDDNMARNFMANPFFAGVESGGDDSIIIGSIGGVLHISKDYNSGHSRGRRSLTSNDTTAMATPLSRLRSLAAAAYSPLSSGDGQQQQVAAVAQVTKEVVASIALLGLVVAMAVVRLARRAAAARD